MKTETYSPGLEGVIAGTTTVSQVDPDRQSLMYRGYDIRDLAEHATYEEVVHLLLYGHLPTQQELDTLKETLVAEREIPTPVLEALRHFPVSDKIHPMDLLKAGNAVLGLYDPEANDNSHDANVRKAIRMVAKFPALITYTYHLSRGQDIIRPGDSGLSHAENFLYMLTGQKPEATVARAFDVSLVTYAEHGFNASTFAARVTASTLSDIYSAITSAIGTLKGPLHGGANEEAMHMLLEIQSPEKAEAWIRDALTTKKKIMGFGHREYKSGDPRAPILKALGQAMAQSLNQTHWDDIGTIVERVMLQEKNLHPNVDFPTAYIYYMMKLPIPIYTPIFALSRVAGWSAHVIEQLDNNRLIRPKSLYEGPKHQAYTPIAQRG